MNVRLWLSGGPHYSEHLLARKTSGEIRGDDGPVLEKFVFMDRWIKKGCPFRKMKHVWFQRLDASKVPALKLLGQKTF